ncbi:MAG: C39 family peptidase [Thermoguttaceae bacterium]
MSRRRTLRSALSILALSITELTIAAGAGPACGETGVRYASVYIQGVPHVRQEPDFCGEACAAMYLRRLGQPADQNYVFDQSGLDPLEGRGCYTKELAVALGRIGFKIGPVWHRAPAGKIGPALESLWKAVHVDLAAGIPSIVCMRYDDAPRASEHFRLVLGYDARADEVIYHDPAVEQGANLRMPRSKFLSLWPVNSGTADPLVVVLRLEPGRLKPAKASDTFTAADYAQHIMRLKKRVPGQGFTIVLEPPFIVLGDQSPELVRGHSEKTVKWAVDRLKRAYFHKDPREILDVWLFRDKSSYEQNCQTVFGHAPTTPFGFFSHTDGALVMNIATGGGTLVHEIVHPFMAANFPDCPAWFNEGMGSLYEQCGDESGEITGYTNWRLVGLQQAIRNKAVPPFRTLLATTNRQFYNEDPGTNYAQARYLCYYLQEKGLLRKFYREFVAGHENDPGGHKTLQAVLGRDDLDAFQRDWEQFVLKLKFP